MLGVYENQVPYGDTHATEFLIEDWVWEEAAIANNMTQEEFDALPEQKQAELANAYIDLINTERN